MQNPTLIVLAGGASSRLWPLREKSLLRFGAHPLLVEQLRRYQAVGFTEAVLVGNPDNAQTLRDLAAGIDGLHTQVVIQPEPKGMGDALLKAAPALALNPHTSVYITQVHDVTDLSLHESVLAAYHDNPLASYLAGVERAEYPSGFFGAIATKFAMHFPVA